MLNLKLLLDTVSTTRYRDCVRNRLVQIRKPLVVGEATPWADVSRSRRAGQIAIALATKDLIGQHEQSLSVTKHF